MYTTYISMYVGGTTSEAEWERKGGEVRRGHLPLVFRTYHPMAREWEEGFKCPFLSFHVPSLGEESSPSTKSLGHPRVS